MSRSRNSHNDPTARLATRENQQLRAVLDSLPDRERRVLEEWFGLLDGVPKEIKQIASLLGLSPTAIRQAQRRGMAKLRHPGRSEVLMVRDGDPSDGLHAALGVIDAGWAFLRERPDTTLGVVECGFCGARFLPCEIDFQRFPRRKPGRRRRYCTNKCRQAAYRCRKARTAAEERKPPAEER